MPGPHRLFFALWPDDAAAGKLEALAAEVADRYRGRAVPRARIHLTLVFLGDASIEGAEAAIDAGDWRTEPFALALDRTGSFARSRVAWAGCREVPGPLMALQDRLSQELRRRGFPIEARAFVPHITLARHIGRVGRARSIEPIVWRVAEFTLVRSDPGAGRYSILRRWGLA